MNKYDFLNLLEHYCLFECVNPNCTNTYCSVHKGIEKLNEEIDKELDEVVKDEINKKNK